MNFSQRLKELRLTHGYTQNELAELLGVTYASIQKYESNRGKPRAKNLEKIAQIFEVSVSYLLGETNIRSSNKISSIMEQLSEPRQENTINYAESQLKQQERDNEAIQLKNTIIPSELEDK